MNSKFTFNDHDKLRGQHALFGASQSSWIRYDDDKIAERVRSRFRTPLGTEIHDFAASQIELRHKVMNVRGLTHAIENTIYTKYKYLNPDQEISEYGMKLIRNLGAIPKEVFEAVKLYINDGIGYRMLVEQPLFYSENIFGTADAISFKNDVLRIHDLKTGSFPAHMDQLEIYASLFCLEYKKHPADIDIELRLYQWDGVSVHNPDNEEIETIMDKIITTEKLISSVEKEK